MGRKTRSDIEGEEQEAIVEWFRLQYPHYAEALRISQSGEYRGSGLAGAKRMARAKRRGVVTGESDIAILLPRGRWGSLLIELKRGEGSTKFPKAQRDYLLKHDQFGNCAVLAKGVDHAIEVIREYIDCGPPRYAD